MLQRKLPPPAYSTPGPSSTPFPLPPKHPLFPRIKQVIVVRRNSSDLFASQHIQILPVELALSHSVSPTLVAFLSYTNMLETIELSPHSDNTYLVVYPTVPSPKETINPSGG